MITETGIEGVVVKCLEKHIDDRGWLAEIWRCDEPPLFWRCREQPNKDPVVMGYMSMTKPGTVRGPHEHVHQTDYFCFPGPACFRVFLWDNRQQTPNFSRTYGKKTIVTVVHPALIVVPPGVVHAYCNIDTCDGLVINMPDRLYKGCYRENPVDEIRHEADPASPFKIDLSEPDGCGSSFEVI